MLNKYRLSRHAPGTAPGTIVPPENALPPVITVIAYNETDLIERTLSDPDELQPLLAEWKMMWVNIDGFGSKEVIEKFGKIFNLHALALEDVLNPYQRPKAEEYADVAFMVMRMAHFTDKKLVLEQISLFMGRRFVLTFQDKPGDCLNPVRDRLRKGAGRPLRTSGSDYLAYALIDAVVDGYFPVLEHYGEWIDRLEDEVIFAPTQKTIERIHYIKRKMSRLRHAVWPMREMIGAFSTHIPHVQDQTRLYLRDCYDHVIQVLDLLETDRERASGLLDIYLSSISNRMNEVMKVLTIISTIFIPLTFIVGVYGMNFDTSSPYNMPELKARYGYPVTLAAMALIAAAFTYYFKRKGWIFQKN
jgi:magnesium transporter